MTTFTAIDGSTVTPRTRADLMKHPAFADLGVDTEGNPCVWMNDYENEEGIRWTDYWSTKCDDEGYPPILSVWRGRCSKWTDTMPREPDDDAYHLWASLPEKGDKEGEAAYGAMLASKAFAAQEDAKGREALGLTDDDMLQDHRELATILAALRYLQKFIVHRGFLPPEFYDIATDGGEVTPLTADEIDALCERINLNVEADPSF